MAQKKQKVVATHRLFHWRTLLTVVMLVIIVVAIVKNWSQVLESLRAMRNVAPLTIFGMLLAYVASVIAAAWSYYILALRPISLRQMVLVETAAASVNRVLPAGTGSVGLHALYFLKKRHTAPQAMAIVTLNNTIGLAEHFTLLGILLLLFGRGERVDWHIAIPPYVWWIVAGVIAVLLALLTLLPRVRKKVFRFSWKFEHIIFHFKDKPLVVAKALLAAFLITATSFAVFSLAVCAFGVHFQLVPFFIVFTLGVVVGITLPTPGGLGGVEAGTTAGLLAYGVSPTHALAAALTFRAVTYWLPLFLGAPAFFIARKRNLV